MAGGGTSHLRVAVYYAPAVDDPLWRAGCSWLGRDPETAAVMQQPAVPGIAEWTESPRGYGFHATLKPPMRLATSYDQFLRDAEDLAGSLRAFELPTLRVADLKGFLALRETEACPALQALSDACVAGLDQHRAAADLGELARRRRGGLAPEQEAMLVRWGYPYVFGTWFFHMTLTRRLNPAEREAVLPAVQGYFAEVLGPRRVEGLTVFTQAATGAPFLVAERLAFKG